MYNDLNTDINDYSVNELFKLAELNPDSTNENINTHFTKIIQGYLKKKDYKMAQFFHDAKEKILKSKNSNNDTKDQSEANEWLENLYRKPINEEQEKELTKNFELGLENDLTKVMINQQLASLGFQMTLNVRNKVLSAYKDIMNMPV